MIFRTSQGGICIHPLEGTCLSFSQVDLGVVLDRGPGTEIHLTEVEDLHQDLKAAPWFGWECKLNKTTRVVATLWFFHTFLEVSPRKFEKLGKMIPFLTMQYFSGGLVQPPTRTIVFPSKDKININAGSKTLIMFCKCSQVVSIISESRCFFWWDRVGWGVNKKRKCQRTTSQPTY